MKTIRHLTWRRSVDFKSLNRFKRSIQKADFNKFLRIEIDSKIYATCECYDGNSS